MNLCWQLSFSTSQIQLKVESFSSHIQRSVITNNVDCLVFLAQHNEYPKTIYPFFTLQVKSTQSWSDCSQTGNILRPVKGNAVLFFTSHLNVSLDPTSTHFRCPVLKGELLVATKLIYAKKQAINDEESGECSDEDENCGQWAELGECKKNPVYMIGSPDYFGTCRKSCNACWFLISFWSYWKIMGPLVETFFFQFLTDWMLSSSQVSNIYSIQTHTFFPRLILKYIQ